MVVGDMLCHPAQATNPDWPFVFDNDFEHAAATRKEVLDEIEAEGLFLVECHFPEPHCGLLVREDGARYWQPAIPESLP